MRDPRHENTMYLLRSKSVKYVSAYPLQSTLRLFLGEGWPSPLFEVVGYTAVTPYAGEILGFVFEGNSSREIP